MFLLKKYTAAKIKEAILTGDGWIKKIYFFGGKNICLVSLLKSGGTRLAL